MGCSHFRLSNNTYKNHVFDGFSQFQQTDEFVDMTMAAEGHLVKVHQTIIALASPYLKELIKSVPCRHPVLFLNNVSHELLSFVLEYIYKGEVQLPDKSVQPFLKVAQAMHLKGLDNILPHTMEHKLKQKEATILNEDVYHENRPPAVEDSLEIKHNDVKFQVDPTLETRNIEDFIDEIVPKPIRQDFPESEGSNQFVGTIDLSSAITRNSVTINIGNSGPTNLKIRQVDNMSNFNFTATQHSEDVPLIIPHQVPQPEPFLKSENDAITVSDSNVNNQSNITIHNNSSGFSNLFNVSNEMPLDNDLAGDVSISDLLDCNKIPTPSTINEIDNVESVKSDNVDSMQSENVECIKSENVENIKTENVEYIETENVENIDTENVEYIETENVENIDTENVEHINSENVPNSQTIHIVNIPSERVEIEEKSGETILYTISNRGSLQMILDRFMYYTHYQAYGGRKRRWRCIDYRNRRCIASMDTDNGVIVKRVHKHCHPNHDKQIWNKAVKNKIFCSLKSVEEIINERRKNNKETVPADDNN